MSHNDSSLSCRSCAFGRRSDALCDIHGTAITNTLVCRSYRAPGQNHMEARAEHPLLENLHPGLVYTIKANKVGDGQALSASFKIEPILRKEPVPKLGDTLVESYNIQVRNIDGSESVSYTHLRAHETVLDLVCRLLLEKKNKHRYLIKEIYIYD